MEMLFHKEFLGLHQTGPDDNGKVGFSWIHCWRYKRSTHANSKIFCLFQMILVIPSLVAGT
jgi:hypothetical protein